MSRLSILLGALVVMGCGEGTKTVVQEPGVNHTVNATQEATTTEEYRALCVDAKQLTIRLLVTNCHQYNADYNHTFDCEGRGEVLQNQLENKWTEILYSVRADLAACRADWRVSEDYCLAEFSVDLSRKIPECQSVVNTNLIY